MGRRPGFVVALGRGAAARRSWLCSRVIVGWSQRSVDEEPKVVGAHATKGAVLEDFGILPLNNAADSTLIPAKYPAASELVGTGPDLGFERLLQSTKHTHSGEQMRVVRETFNAATKFMDLRVLPEEMESKLNRLLSTTLVLMTLKVDMDTLLSGVIYQSVRDGYLKEREAQNLRTSEKVDAIVADSLWLDVLPASLYNLDDDNAKILREYVMEAAHDPRAVLVKLAEVLTSMRDVQKLALYQQHITALECLQVYVPLAHAVGVGKLMWDLEDLCFRVLFPESYAVVEDWHSKQWLRWENIIQSAKVDILTEIEQNEFIMDRVDNIEISGRTKNLFSTFKKILRDNKPKEEIMDIIGIRIIVRPKEDYTHDRWMAREVCLEIQHIVTHMWPEIDGRFKDYILCPKANGYMSLHTTVNHPGGYPLELQIRTDTMHHSAEFGTAGHQFYKGGLGSIEEVSRFAENMRAENVQILRLPGSVSGEYFGENL
eukprot:Plantae.Rhodophyta-Purpureofilum_apyrenoidigerum.ctg9234.p1 GENE.Plantae.Rhodophyta-Purpureofilum_apyrenoidigerum.ctg9234~~Plantae.Rhodophyta-Purpureofilum_apyrenoidigerum.ctg9234.p1  ORF type:complete len:487 (+),score=92.55 Plantae.Rhodophyta-Purpureofilum_apyrenoidigerum.ctg9234:117-1577(+)